MISGAVTVVCLLANSKMSMRIKRMEYEIAKSGEKRQRMIDPYKQLVSLIFEILTLVKQNKTINDTETLIDYNND
ncbi:MAG: hypothetical protein FWE06_07305 [Oscillospiraceae bacterium]|nr:hypothetical protein [Oscillospiraceae bacterium]